MEKSKQKTRCNRCSHANTFLQIKHLVNDDRTKICPKCRKIQKYTDNSTYYKSLLNNTCCNSCKEFDKKHRENLSISRRKRKMITGSYLKRKKTIELKYPNGIKKSKESIQKSVDGLKRWRELNPDKERKRIDKSRKTLLDCYGDYFSKGGGPLFNKKACEHFEKINFELGWRGVYATNGGEYTVRIDDYTQYYVDYYDIDKNVVIEYDEYHHFKPSYDKRLEKIRETKIKKFLGCKFYRIKYNEDINGFIERLRHEFI
jgi:hypothetical protein